MVVNHTPPDTDRVVDRRHLRIVTAGILVALALLTSAPSASALLDEPTPPRTVKVIVQLGDGTDLVTRALVGTLGGVITSELPVVNGFAATIPESEVPTLAAAPGVRVLSPDTPLQFQGLGGGNKRKSVHKQVLDAAAAHSAGATGAGVGVAIVDTGVADVGPLHDRLQRVGVATCKNFSNEPGCGDSLGHGTFIAGLVNDIAPDAELLAVKLVGRDGKGDLSVLLNALGWVIANKDAYDIKVLNLSLKTYSPMSYRIDPINVAVERAWAAGITVVVSAGNDGPSSGTIAKPGDDPFVITVGSTDDRETATINDDIVAPFSGRGPSVPDGVAKPDVVVPGTSLVSLRSPGSEADRLAPNFYDATRRYGSGTSFSAPLVAGAAAVLHGADPSATNDHVKFALVAAGRPIPGATAEAAGAGTFDVPGALAAPAGEANEDVFHPLFSPSGDASLEDVAGTPFEAEWLAAEAEGWNWQGWNWQGWNWQEWNPQGWNWQGWNWQGTSWQGWNWQGWNWQGWNWQGWNWQGWNWQGWNWQSEYWS
jgi:serine protease AprX